MPAWPLVPLGKVLTRNEERIALLPDQTYREVTVRLWGKGVTLRRLATGAEIAGEGRFVVRTNQFIASRIDARNGAFGLIPPELDGAIVTNDFPTFNVDASRLLPEFLGWQCRTSVFVDLARAASEGTTNRVRLKGASFLATTIPLPAVEEQRRIVARVDAIASRVAEARRLREELETDNSRLLIQMAHRADMTVEQKAADGWRETRLGDVIEQVQDAESVDTSASYPNFGIYSYAKGLFQKLPISGLETSATALYRVQAGQFIYSRLFAFEGSYGQVAPEFDGQFVSGEYPTFNCPPDTIRSEFLAAYFKAKSVWATVAVGSKGLGDRRQRVQPKQLLQYRFWLPPITWQAQIANVQAKLDAVRAVQSATAADLDALLPSVLNQAFAGKL